jgi:hypothetical protein
MASIVQLKRSALSGKVPGTGSLNLGELAVNTYDGKIYFKKSGSIESVESILTTNSVVTGSIRLEGTGSFGSLRVNDTLTINHGEAIISGSALVTNDLTILGQVNARQFNISIISSSTLFESGSSNFGNTLDDTHTFTGSVNITGSFLLNGQEVGGGTTTGSFTGSFTGDGSGLRGVVSDELPRNGYDYNIDDIATINDFNATSSKYLIDFDIDAMIGTPVGHKTYIANFTGSTKVIPAGDSVRFHVRDVEVARIDENGFSGSINFPAGVVSGSSQLTSSYDTRYVFSGSITQTTWDNIANKPAGIISGSSQLTASYDTRYTLSGSVSNSSISSSMMESTKYIADGTTTIFTIPGGYYTKMLQVFLNGSKLDESEYTETDSSNITITPPISSGSVLEIVNFKAAALNTGLSRKIETYIATEGQLVFNTTASASLGNVDVHINGFKLPPQDFVITNSNTITLTTGSSVGELVEIGLYDAFFGTYLTNTDLNSLNSFTASVSTASLASSITNLNSLTSSLATTGSNTFRGTQILSGSIIPATDNTYDLGSPTYQWRDIYVSSGSLYIDGTKVLSSTNQELQITTDEGQSIKILEAGSDNIILQSADGDIQLKTSGGGNLLFDPTSGLIDVRGTLQIQDGNKITSSGGNGVVFGNNIVVSGSFESTGNINGINLSTFSSSIASTLLNQNTSASSYETIGRGIVSGSSQITLGSINGFSTYSSSVDNRIATEKGRVDAILSASDADKDTFAEIVTLINSVDTTNDQAFASFYTGSNNRLNNLESVTSSYETKGRGIISGSSQITFNGISSLPTLVSGSSQITLSSTTGYGSVLNQAVLTTSSPTFASITSNGNINIPGTNKIVFNNEPLSWFLQARTTASTANLGSGLKNLIYNGGGANEGIAFSGVDTGAASMEVRNDGRVWIKENLIVGGTLTENSSIRYKENVETIKYGLDKVLQMRGVTYDKKDNGVKEMGVIAEEVYDVLPEVVLKNEEGEIDSVSYGRIVGVLIEAIKEQQKQIEELKSLIK